ncbi:MAG: hypothetical protein BWY75_00229 [bacterium ADurb.Bin425]|nr:MAG: hypothetical protein BWY75_00229 [bacterium ADurb.Bin425]
MRTRLTGGLRIAGAGGRSRAPTGSIGCVGCLGSLVTTLLEPSLEGSTLLGGSESRLDLLTGLFQFARIVDDDKRKGRLLLLRELGTDTLEQLFVGALVAFTQTGHLHRLVGHDGPDFVILRLRIGLEEKGHEHRHHAAAGSSRQGDAPALQFGNGRVKNVLQVFASLRIVEYNLAELFAADLAVDDDVGAEAFDDHVAHRAFPVTQLCSQMVGIDDGHAHRLQKLADGRLAGADTAGHTDYIGGLRLVFSHFVRHGYSYLFEH